ncbi:MAG TPA: hypothetical protein VK539_11700 [Myxococcaceae bacterium]|nr:hypothetical protein [Myxococcaceae bacterium]
MTISKQMPAPEGFGQRPILLMDVLLFIRKEVDQGRPLWFFLGGETHVQAMVAFIAGYRAGCHYNGLDNTQYNAFVTWLRDVKHEFPGEGWAQKYLADCGGDHERAIRRFLDFVAEYTALTAGH